MLKQVRFQVLAATIMKIAVFCEVARRKIPEDIFKVKTEFFSLKKLTKVTSTISTLQHTTCILVSSVAITTNLFVLNYFK
jgi:hypothetical protein